MTLLATTIAKCRYARTSCCVGLHTSLPFQPRLAAHLTARRTLASSSKQGSSLNAQESLLSRFLAWYSKQLDTNPLRTKAITSGIIAGAGDLLCQVFVGSPTLVAGNEEMDKTDEAPRAASNFSWDPARTGRFALLGAFLIAPGIHFWYNALNLRLVPGPSTVQNVVKRVLLDQFIFTPLFLPVWLTSLWTLEGETDFQSMPGRMAQVTPSILLANWMLWIPAQLVNFRFVTVKYQVLYSNMVALLWNMYLSYHTTSPKKESAVGT